MDDRYRNSQTFTLKDLTDIDKTYRYEPTNGEYEMKLDKMKFARVVAFAVANGMAGGEYEVNTLDELIDIEAEAAQINNINLELLMQSMANGTHKIEAVKCHRALTGMSLKDSKDIVETFWRTQQISATALQEKMLNVLNKEECSIRGEDVKAMVRNFISSFSCYS